MIRAHMMLLLMGLGLASGCYPQTGRVPDATPDQLLTQIKQACVRRDTRAADMLHQRLGAHPQQDHRASARARSLGARSGVCAHY